MKNQVLFSSKDKVNAKFPHFSTNSASSKGTLALTGRLIHYKGFFSLNNY